MEHGGGIAAAVSLHQLEHPVDRLDLIEAVQIRNAAIAEHRNNNQTT